MNKLRVRTWQQRRRRRRRRQNGIRTKGGKEENSGDGESDWAALSWRWKIKKEIFVLPINVSRGIRIGILDCFKSVSKAAGFLLTTKKGRTRWKM
jgi:hypothetical protein